MKRFTSIANKSYSLILIIILIAIWHISVSAGLVNDFVLPYPLDVVTTLFKIRGELFVHLKVTIQEAMYGLLFAILLSITFAFIMDQFLIVKKALFPIFLVSQTVPVILLAPLLSMWFGFGMFPKILVVILVCFFPIVVSLNEGLESVDVDEIDLLRSMGASYFQIFKIVKFPSAAISFFSGLKVAATYSFMGAVISEWMGGKEGLGIYYLRAKKSFDINRVFAVVLVIIIMSMLIYFAVSQLQKLTMPWNNKEQKS